MPSVRNRYDGMARTAERLVMLVLIVCGAILIVVPLLLTLYLSLFDEKLILFPPRGYTLEWYSAIVPNFGGAIVTSLKLGMLAVFGSLAAWRPRRHRPGAPSLPRPRRDFHAAAGATDRAGHRAWPRHLRGAGSARRTVRLHAHRLDGRTGAGAHHDHHALGGAALPRQPDQPRSRGRGGGGQSGRRTAHW